MGIAGCYSIFRVGFERQQCACMLSTFVGIAACAFDSGGVGGPVDGGFADESGTSTSTSSTGTTTSDPSSTTQGSASADGTSEATTDDPIDESSTTAPPIDPCAGTGGCDFDASCSPDPSGEVAVCDCNDGFVGNGRTCVVAPSLPMLRAEAECGTTVGDYCTTGGASSEVAMGGELGFSYVVSLRIRGVVETKAYDGGTQDGLWHSDGDPGDIDLWNTVTLSISSPAQTIRMNSGSSGGTSLVLVDYMHDVTIDAGAVVRLEFDEIDGSQISNNDDVVVPGIPPAPDAFDGQFLQIDAIAIELP
jgi:hypothetical protein